MCEATGLPPSAKLVLNTLDDHGPLTHGEIVEEAELPKSTTSWAIERLREEGAIVEVPDTDPRTCVYRADR